MDTHDKRSIRDEGPSVQNLDQGHNYIGWSALLNGQVSTVWKEILVPGKRNSGERWVRLLIKKIWYVTWNQWEHRNEVVHQTDNVMCFNPIDIAVPNMFIYMFKLYMGLFYFFIVG
jgi:hypothetical protein